MNRIPIVALLASLAALGGAPSPGRAAEPSRSSPSPASVAGAGASALVLSGPFGSVAGAEPAADAPRHGAPAGLDAFFRSAPLRLEAGRPAEPLEEWLVTATPLQGGEATVLASQEPGDTATPSLRFAGPVQPGSYRIAAAVVTESGGRIEGSWVLEVPDRHPPANGLLEVPAPALVASSGSGSLAGWPGSGCYVYLCVEVGRIPPLRTLERLAVVSGQPIRLRLSDGSRMAAWEAAYLPIEGGLQPATSRRTGSPAEPVTEVTLPAPVAGEWLLMVELEYDRARGWAHVFFRLSAADPEAQAPAASGTTSGAAG